ncbi:unnamed protein product [Acanthoscelides obtectus]|uniref:Uncharacterized protein n=1 Tax=Acanthoscelides obtectus TaxID=200917 RepID=A0A9P0PQ33_ACAOB|nr:unnamed protein product [Acanthoscelides obtectus]CAK1649771.1 hypothetical protein AOBTE_LOCUS16420 [Acanthoscelides obtectus]
MADDDVKGNNEDDTDSLHYDSSNEGVENAIIDLDSSHEEIHSDRHTSPIAEVKKVFVSPKKSAPKRKAGEDPRINAAYQYLKKAAERPQESKDECASYMVNMWHIN